VSAGLKYTFTYEIWNPSTKFCGNLYKKRSKAIDTCVTGDQILTDIMRHAHIFPLLVSVMRQSEWAHELSSLTRTLG
jgi:predicted HAD superfamily phosphohydrolase YqeG